MCVIFRDYFITFERDFIRAIIRVHMSKSMRNPISIIFRGIRLVLYSHGVDLYHSGRVLQSCNSCEEEIPHPWPGLFYSGYFLWSHGAVPWHWAHSGTQHHHPHLQILLLDQVVWRLHMTAPQVPQIGILGSQYTSFMGLISPWFCSQFTAGSSSFVLIYNSGLSSTTIPSSPLLVFSTQSNISYPFFQ